MDSSMDSALIKCYWSPFLDARIPPPMWRHTLSLSCASRRPSVSSSHNSVVGSGCEMFLTNWASFWLSLALPVRVHHHRKGRVCVCVWYEDHSLSHSFREACTWERTPSPLECVHMTVITSEDGETSNQSVSAHHPLVSARIFRGVHQRVINKTPEHGDHSEGTAPERGKRTSWCMQMLRKPGGVWLAVRKRSSQRRLRSCEAHFSLNCCWWWFYLKACFLLCLYQPRSPIKTEPEEGFYKGFTFTNWIWSFSWAYLAAAAHYKAFFTERHDFLTFFCAADGLRFHTVWRALSNFSPCGWQMVLAAIENYCPLKLEALSLCCCSNSWVVCLTAASQLAGPVQPDAALCVLGCLWCDVSVSARGLWYAGCSLT